MVDPQPDQPVGAVDAFGEPMTMPGMTPPEQPPTLDEDCRGEINGEVDDLQVQGGE